MMDHRAEDFLWYSYFGYTKEKLDRMYLEEVLTICAKRAYRDMNRTLGFKKSVKRDDFRKSLNEKVADWCKELMTCTAEEFDKSHTKACCEIKDTANASCVLHNDFTYGQAQKWLNMTMKYLWLMGRVESERVKCLHIPIDNRIMKKLAEKFKIKFPQTPLGELLPYSKTKTLAWSKWEQDDYEKVLENIQKNENIDYPIEWENDAWME